MGMRKVNKKKRLKRCTNGTIHHAWSQWYAIEEFVGGGYRRECQWMGCKAKEWVEELWPVHLDAKGYIIPDGSSPCSHRFTRDGRKAVRCTRCWRCWPFRMSIDHASKL
jgi:hypothetical protein